MELRFFYADKAVFGDDVTADHGLAHDSEEALGEFVIAGDFHGVGAEQIELVGVGLAVCHAVGRRGGAGGRQRGKIVHNAEFHGETAVLDGARGGAFLGELDLIDRLFLVGAADVAERDQVGLVQQEDAAALERSCGAWSRQWRKSRGRFRR